MLKTYNYVPEGMVFFLKNKRNEKEEIVFDNNELGEMYANQLSDKKNDEMIEKALSEKADFSEYDEDTYNRIYILLLSSIEKVTRRDPIHSYYDEEGFTADIEEGRVEIPADTLKSVNEPSFSSALAKLDDKFREKSQRGEGKSKRGSEFLQSRTSHDTLGKSRSSTLGKPYSPASCEGLLPVLAMITGV